MKACDDPEVDAMEGHLRLCEQCRARLYEAEEWVSLMKMAIPLGPSRQRQPGWLERLRLPQRAGQWFPQPLAVTAGCAALLALLVASPLLLREPREERVRLEATRGLQQSPPTVSSGSIAILELDARDLTDPLEGQIVDVNGTPVWTEPISQSKPEVRTSRPLEPGLYWVRINSRQGKHELLREFEKLRVR